MNKQDFIASLRASLSGLPKQDVEDRLNFYSEMIDDRIEEGLTEQEAVLAIGSVTTVSSQIIADIPLSKIAKEKIKPKRGLRAWEILLLALGSPIWLSLLIAAFAVILSLYVSIWSVIVSLWAVFASLVACAAGEIIAGIVFIVVGNVLTGVCMIGTALVCAGLSIFSFFGCKAATKGLLWLTKKLAIVSKNALLKRRKCDE